MSASWTDDELLRICAGTSLANIDPDQWAAFQQRWLKAESFQQAVENSPIRNELLARLSDSGSHTATELPIASTARSRSGRFARLAVLLVGIAVTAFFAVRESQLRPDGFDVAQQGDDAEITIGSTQADHPSKSAQADDVTNPTAGSEQGANAETTPVTTTTPSVTTTPVAAAAGEDGVWNGPLDLQKPPLNLQDTVWQPTAAIAPDGMTPAVFAKWFQAVANRPFKLSEDKVDKRVFTNFEGHTRLRAPWVDAAVLRLALYSVDKCDITFWRANAGIRFTLVKSPTPVIWAAYRVTRADSKSDAVLGELLGTDNARWEISRFGIFECRVEHSHVMLARGHIPLVRVPFEGLPDEVHFEGKFRIRDLRMYRGDPLPVHEFDAYRGPQGINQLATTNPAELDWTVNVDDAVTFEKVIANGTTQAAAVELRTNASLKETAFAVLPVPKAGLSEIVFRVEHADAGTGLCIGAASGPPYSKVGFQLEPKSKRVVAMAPMPWLQVSEVSKDTSSVPIAYLGPTQWFRLIGSAASGQV